VQIGDYWSDEIVEKIADFMREYQDLFPTTFLRDEIARLVKIPLKPVLTERPYRINPKYKEKVKEEIDRMLGITIIEPMVESEWISPMVVQDKNT
jgi:hypothetical protein